MAKPKSPLAEAIRRWWDHPSTFVKEQFGVDPDPWQYDVLEAFPHNPYMAMAACKGPGKTATLAWLILNFIITRPHPKIAATSISGDNLKDNLWSEIALWRGKSPLLMAMFEWTTTRLISKDYPETWWASARTWPKTGDAQQQANTLAGLHADYIMFLLDESGGIPDAVMVSAEAALSSCKEGHIVQAGNPTHLSGPLYRASKSRLGIDQDGKWLYFEITADPDNPKRTPRVSVEWAKDQIKTYGRDNPWVLVNVFGRFPPASINALIGEEEVLDAMKREYTQQQIAPFAKIIGADVARQGGDASVIAKRQGPQFHRLQRYRNIDGNTGASILNRESDALDSDAIFVDATGGLGFTWIDCLAPLGKTAIPVQFASQARANDRYVNKRAEMYFEFVQAIRNGAALPPLETEGAPELMKALINTTYLFKNDKMILEEKEQIRSKIGFSPDEADACAITYAEPVSPKVRQQHGHRSQRSAIGGGYDPFAEVQRMSGSLPRGVTSDYNPFERN